MVVTAREIKKLRVLYSHYLDGKDLAGLVALFTQDVVCDFGHYGTWAGKDELRGKYQAVYSDRDGSNQEPFQTVHIITNHWVELKNSEHAVGRCYLVDVLTTHGDKPPFRLLAIYDDTYNKLEGNWKICRTRIDFLWPARLQTRL
jgi:hypothetical protein